MKFANRALILLLLFALQASMAAMVKPPSKFPETPPHRNFFSAGRHAVLMMRLGNAEANVKMGSKIAESYAEFSTDDLGEIIALVKVILENPTYFELAYNKYSMGGRAFDRESYRKKLKDSLRNAEAELAQRKTKSQALPISKQSVQIPSQALPLQQEQAEEEIQADRLYVILDIKDRNIFGQPILWQEPISIISSQISDGKFVPSDYFHITIAWYESKSPISPELTARVEHALMHASQILKIVFPNGVTGISLLDKAILLGNKKDSVAFRVSESADLKKLQEILLKFLSFEKIDGFKFNIFDKETPLHVTLGKIRPAKKASQYQDVAGTLKAPDGARESKGERSLINTFRLTYSVAGQTWQEKMSYKF